MIGHSVLVILRLGIIYFSGIFQYLLILMINNNFAFRMEMKNQKRKRPILVRKIPSSTQKQQKGDVLSQVNFLRQKTTQPARDHMSLNMC